MFVAAAIAAVAQTGGGATLVGTVKDSTGATVSGAKVTVVNTATNLITENVTSTEGADFLPLFAWTSSRAEWGQFREVGV